MGEPPAAPPKHERPSFRAVLRYFIGLGTWGFGGPIATVGYMQRDLVEKRGWLDRGDFLDGVALGQTMPGPLAAQVVMWVGYLQRGAFGALGTSLIFILPSFVLVLAVTALTGAEVAVLFIAAGLVMVMWEAPPRFLKRGHGANLGVLAAVP